MSMANMLSDIDASTEEEKLRFALELAVHQVTKEKEGKQAQDLNESVAEKKDKKLAADNKTANVLGTSRIIKLPFIIGSKEYLSHPYAGLVYMGMDFEDGDQYKEEQKDLMEDKIAEMEER